MTMRPSWQPRQPGQTVATVKGQTKEGAAGLAQRRRRRPWQLRVAGEAGQLQPLGQLGLARAAQWWPMTAAASSG